MKIVKSIKSKIQEKRGLKAILQEVIGIGIVIVLIAVVIFAFATKTRKSGETSYDDLNTVITNIDKEDTGGLSEPLE